MIFINYMGFAMLGFILHILTKLANARMRKPDFSVGRFIELNTLQYLTSFFLILTYVVLVTNGSIPYTGDFTLVVVGYGGGSLMKNLLKKKE